MTHIPAELSYSQDHMWVRPDTGTRLVRIGVTDFAQQSLGDIVAVALLHPGEKVAAVYASDLQRACLTAGAIAGRHGLQAVCDKALREVVNFIDSLGLVPLGDEQLEIINY